MRAASSARLGATARPVIARFAEIVCPPELISRHRLEPLLAEFELTAGALPAAARRALAASFVALDQGARLFPGSRGRRLTRLRDVTATAYVTAVLSRRGAVAQAARRLKSLVVLCYYELPDVWEEVGYRPGPYLAAVARRRLTAYAAEIRAGEAAVSAPGPPGQGAL